VRRRRAAGAREKVAGVRAFRGIVTATTGMAISGDAAGMRNTG
jgi:hypothetical protein